MTIGRKLINPPSAASQESERTPLLSSEQQHHPSDNSLTPVTRYQDPDQPLAVDGVEGGGPPAYQPRSGAGVDIEAAGYQSIEQEPSSSSHVPPPGKQSHRRHRVLKRFLLALVIAIVLYMFASGIHRSDNDDQSTSGRHPGQPPKQDGHGHRSVDWTLPVPIEGEDEEHRRKSRLNWFTSTMNFTLPLSASPGLFVHAFGVDVYGWVRVIHQEDKDATPGLIGVGVETIFHQLSRRNGLWVGQMVQKDGSQGIGVYGDKRWNPRREEDELEVLVTLFLPGTSSFDSATIPSLEISTESLKLVWDADPSLVLPIESIVLQNDAGSTHLGSLQANEGITVTSDAGSISSLTKISGSPHVITAKTLDVRSDAAGIRLDDLNFATKLKVQSDAGSIRLGKVTCPKVEVTSDSGSIRGSYIVTDRLTLASDSGSIGADIHLPGLPLGQESSVVVSAKSDSGRVSLHYLNHHSSVLLDNTVSSDSGSVQAGHHANYQGTFKLKTSSGSVYFHKSEEDKTLEIDKDRKGSVGHTVLGRIYREEKGDERMGTTKVSSDSGSVRATL